MKKSLFIVSLILLGIAANAYSPSVQQQMPLPNVQVKANEVLNADLNQYFSGYNVTYTTNASFAAVQGPLNALAAADFGPATTTDTPTFTFQSYPQDKTGNLNYGGYILYLTMDNYLYWANISNSSYVPQMVFGFQVTNLKYVHCYGADQINNDLVVVDCAEYNSTSGVQTDWFFFVSVSQQNIVATYNRTATANTTYNSTTGMATRGVKTADFGNGNHFIFRYVGSDALTNGTFQNDSYIEVYKAMTWTQPQPATIISRTLLGADTLNLADFKVLNNALFILSSTGTIYSLQNFAISFESATTYTFTVPTGYTPIGITVGIEYYQTTPKLTVLLYTNNLVWELDWTIANTPKVVQNYTFNSDITVVKADYSSSYIIAQVLSASLGTNVVSLTRGSAGFSQLKLAIPATNLLNVIWWGLDRGSNNLFLWDANISLIHNFHFQKSWLLFNSSISGNGSVTVTATSYGNDGTNKSVSANFNYLVINETDFGVYPNASSINMTLFYPSPFSVPIDGAVTGPGLNYTVATPNPLPSYTFQSYENLNLALPQGFNPTKIYFHKITPNTSAPGTMNWLVQGDNFILYNLWCTDTVNQATQAPLLNCSINGNIALTAAVSHMVITAQYVTAISSDKPNYVLFLEPNLKVIANISTGDPVINPCADLVLLPSGSYVACSQTIPKQIILWDAAHPDPATQIVIDRSYINVNQFPNFSPSSLIVNSAFPDYLFVKNTVGVIVLDLVLLKSLSTIQVLTNVVLADAYLSPPNFDFVVNGNSILFFLYQGAQTLLQEYSLSSDPTNPLLVKQYSQFFAYTFQVGASAHHSSDSTNRFFSVVQDSQQNPQLLAFQAGARANDNYLHGFNLNWTAGAALLSGAHSTIINAEYLLIGNANAKLAAFVVYDRTLFTSSSYLSNNNSVSESSSFNLTATSSLQPTSTLPVQFSVKTFNTNPPVAPGPLANNTDALNFINFTSNKTSFVFNPSDFFNGVITSFALAPQNSNDSSKITLQTPVGSPSTAFSAAKKILDLTITAPFTYAQASNTLFQLNSSNLSSVLNIIDMSVSKITPTNQRCEGVLADDTSPYTISFCMDTSNKLGYFIVVSLLSSTPTPLPPILSELTSLTCMRNIGSFVLALENPNGVIMNPGAKLHIYDFTNPTAPVYKGFLGGSFFGTNSFQVGRWDIAQITTNYYRLFFIDARFGVRTAEWNATSGQFLNPLSYNLLNDAAFQADNIPATSIFLGIGCLQRPANVSVSNDTTVAIITDTYNSYYVKLSFTPTGLTATLIAVYKKLSAAVNLPKITAINSGYTYFAVSSYDSNTKEGFVTIYNATSSNQASQVTTLSYPPAAEGNIAFTLFPDAGAIKFWAFTPNASNNSMKGLKDQSTGSVQQYQITPFYSINVAPNSNITSKYVNLTGSNDHSSATVSFNITYTPTPETKSSSKWWIWLLVALGIIAIVGLVFAYINHRKKKEDGLLADDANAPLASNYA